MLKWFSWFILISAWVNIEAKDNAIIRRDLNFTELVEFDGYNYEVHTVTTEDGYILTNFRLPPPETCAETVGDPVVCVHGLYLDADQYVVPGPGKSIPYLFVDECRDVWLLNMRGTLNSRRHVTLNPDKDTEFWNFTWKEMGLYDISASIDDILTKTGKKKVAYVSHAQGGPSLMYLCIKRPEYNDKISVGFGLSMTAWLFHARFIVLKVQESLSPLLGVAIKAGVNCEFVPRNGFYQPLAKSLCGTTVLSYPLCNAFYHAVLGDDKEQVDPDTFRVLTGHIPSGTSCKNFNCWGEITKFGFNEGKQECGSTAIDDLLAANETRTEFDLSQVTMKWYIIDSKNDYVSDEKDVDILIPKLPNAVKCVVSDESTGHLDYVFGKSAYQIVAPMISHYLDTNDFVCM